MHAHTGLVMQVVAETRRASRRPSLGTSILCVISEPCKMTDDVSVRPVSCGAITTHARRREVGESEGV
jgi:hypothetical protein